MILSDHFPTSEEDYQASYSGLNLKVSISGKIKLAKDFIEELYVHMGYQKPSAFKTVLDFQFILGAWVEAIFSRTEDVCRIIGDQPVAWNMSMSDDMSEDERDELITSIIYDYKDRCSMVDAYLASMRE